MSSSAESYRDHLEAGDCLHCKTVSAVFAVAVLSAAATLIIDAFAGFLSDAAFYGAVLVLALSTVAAIRARGWHHTRLHLRHRAGH